VDGAPITSTEAPGDMGYDLEGDPKACKLEVGHVGNVWSTLIEGSSLDETPKASGTHPSDDMGKDALVAFRLLLAALQDRYNGLKCASDWVRLLGKLLKHTALKDSEDLLTNESAAPQSIEDVCHLTHMLFSKVVQVKIAAVQGSARLLAARCCALRVYPFTDIESLLSRKKTDEIPEELTKGPDGNFDSISKKVPFRLILPEGGPGGFTENICSCLRQVSKAQQTSACQPTNETLLHFLDSWVSYVYSVEHDLEKNIFCTDRKEITCAEDVVCNEMRVMAIEYLMKSKNTEVERLVGLYDSASGKAPKELKAATLGAGGMGSLKESGWQKVKGKLQLVPVKFLVQVMTYLRINLGPGRQSNYVRFVRTKMVRSVRCGLW